MSSAEARNSAGENSEPHFEEIGKLAQSVVPFPSSTLVPRVAELFFREKQIDAIPIVDGDRAVGIVTRQKLFFQVLRQFGWEIYKHHPISELVENDTLTLRQNVTLDIALNLALARRAEDVYDEILVVDDRGSYIGLLSVRRMVVEQSHSLANMLVQKNLADERARELERIGELKSQFLANVTHELRSPVNAIIELTELISMAAERGFVEQLRDRLTLLLVNATNLRSVITNMPDLSKIEAGKMHVITEQFDLISLLREVAETGRVLAGGKPIEFDIVTSESYCPMYSDAVKVRQVIMNLVSNAAKFTDHGRIAIRQSSEGEYISIDVSDTGCGIARENLSRLFVAFSQIEDASTKRHEGTGLGLTITRQLAHLLGGSVAVSSELGRGSTFSIQLPRRYEEEREIA